MVLNPVLEKGLELKAVHDRINGAKQAEHAVGWCRFTPGSPQVHPRFTPGWPQVWPRLTPGWAQVDHARFQRLKLKYDELLSKFAFNFSLRRYSKAESRWKSIGAVTKLGGKVGGRLLAAGNVKTPAAALTFALNTVREDGSDGGGGNGAGGGGGSGKGGSGGGEDGDGAATGTGSAAATAAAMTLARELSPPPTPPREKGGSGKTSARSATHSNVSSGIATRAPSKSTSKEGGSRAGSARSGSGGSAYGVGGGSVGGTVTKLLQTKSVAKTWKTKAKSSAVAGRD